MILSLVLLVSFQAYWLRNTYVDEFASLRREVGLALRETAFRKQFQIWSSDSGMARMGRRDTTQPGMVVVTRVENGTVPKGNTTQTFDFTFKPDTTAKATKDDGKKGDNNDREKEREHRNSHNTKDLKVIAFKPLGVKGLAGIDSSFRKALKEDNIDLSYTLRQLNAAETDSLSKNEMRMVLPPNRRNRQGGFNFEIIQASFEHPFWFLLPKMGWQIAFSILMLGITIGAFLFLFRNLRQQEKLTLLKNDFISNITHELKTPIATVGVAIEALKNFNAMNDAARTKEYLDISAAELQRLNLLVDKVLKFSMFEKEAMEFRKEEVDMKHLVEEVLNSMKLQFDKTRAKVALTVSGNSFYIKGDRMHLQSVVYNLVDNAIKYSPANPEINIALEGNDNGVALKVSDNGIGISPEFQHKIFDKFFRVPHGDTHNIKGYGLGLSYVAEVVKQHGGNIDLNSATGKGTTFEVHLPK